MLSLLVQGTVTADPVSRISSKGSPFTTATLRAVGENGEPVICSLIAFSQSAAESLASLRGGDACAVAGDGSLHHWESSSGEHRVGLRITASRVLTVDDAARRRKAAGARRSDDDAEVR